MFDFGRITEFLIIVVAALVLIGPKEIPHVLYTLGRWLRKFQVLRDHLKQSIEPYIQDGKADEYYQHINHAVLDEPSSALVQPIQVSPDTEDSPPSQNLKRP